MTIDKKKKNFFSRIRKLDWMKKYLDITSMKRFCLLFDICTKSKAMYIHWPSVRSRRRVHPFIYRFLLLIYIAYRVPTWANIALYIYWLIDTHVKERKWIWWKIIKEQINTAATSYVFFPEERYSYYYHCYISFFFFILFFFEIQ
jgi:hypothetical protein